MKGYIKLTVTADNRMVFEVVETDKVPSLQTLQEVVGGLIEAMFTVPSKYRKGYSITGYVNEEGLLISLPIIGAVNDSYGFRPFAGPMVIAGLKNSTGDSVLLTSEEIELLRNSYSEVTSKRAQRMLEQDLYGILPKAVLNMM